MLNCKMTPGMLLSHLPFCRPGISDSFDLAGMGGGAEELLRGK